MMSRRGFLARLTAAPIVALTLLKAPARPHTLGSFGEEPSVTPHLYDDGQRFDILYGYGSFSQSCAVRIEA